MAEFFPALTAEHRAFIARQPVFFVATAAAESRINLSPKGLDCFRVLDDSTVAWLDLMGSGNETNAHLIADGRITVMFCAFDRPALIFRLYGHAQPVLPQDASGTPSPPVSSCCRARGRSSSWRSIRRRPAAAGACRK